MRIPPPSPSLSVFKLQGGASVTATAPVAPHATDADADAAPDASALSDVPAMAEPNQGAAPIGLQQLHDRLTAIGGSHLATLTMQAHGLDRSSAEVADPQQVEQVMKGMATAQSALSGFSFATRLELSPRHDRPAFRDTVAEMGLDPARLDATARAAIQQRFDLKLDGAIRSGQLAIDLPAGRAFLREAIVEVTGPAV